jgi:hypothetical protein
MNEQTNNNLYQAETILRYLNGHMDREETRAFERVLIDDDLLAEAVEGYRLLQKTMSENAILEKVESIKNTTKAAESSPKASVVQMPAFRWLSYAVAASFVVAAGWWLFSLSRPDVVLPEDAGSKNLLVTPNNEVADESITTTPEGVSSEGLSKPVESKEETGMEKAKVDEKTTTTALKRADETASLKDATPASPQKMLPPDAAMAEKVIAEQEAKTRRMMPSSVQSAMQYRFTWDFADSVKVSPKNGWHAYRKFLAEQFTPMAPLEIAATAILTIDENGKIYSVKFEGPLTEEENKKLEKAIKNGPEWINHTRARQETTIQWQ